MTEAHKPGRQAHAPRHLARVFALLGFYQWIADPTLKAQKIEENLPALLADDEEGTPVEDLGLTSEDWARCDRELLTTLLSGAIGEHAALEAEFSSFVDRDLKRVSLVERAILFIGTYELLRCPQTPYRVVLNETIELDKHFGSGYRFTNAVLERVAAKVRAAEFEADHAQKKA